jgi:hypothetical protein
MDQPDRPILEWKTQLELVRKRPLMYLLAGSERPKLTPAACYMNFLYGVLEPEDEEFGKPHRIDLITNGTHHQAVAYGFVVPEDITDSTSLAEWGWSQERLYPLAYLANDIAATEHSMLEFSSAHRHYRQSYFNGLPSSPVVSSVVDAPYISVSFTATTGIFDQHTLTLDDVRRLWHEFRKDHSDPRRVNVNSRHYFYLVPGARIKSYCVDEHTFVFRISWQRQVAPDA